jgi:hypothetical protein
MFALTSAETRGDFTESHEAAIRALSVSIDNSRLDSSLRVEPDPSTDSGQLVPMQRLNSVWLPLVHVRRGKRSDDRRFITISMVLAGEINDEDCALGWRFEAPEGPGEHCFWHAQPIREVRLDNGVVNLTLPAWVPVNMPTLPLAAENPEELLLCALVSIYGHHTTSLMASDFDYDFSQELASIDVSVSAAGLVEP